MTSRTGNSSSGVTDAAPECACGVAVPVIGREAANVELLAVVCGYAADVEARGAEERSPVRVRLPPTCYDVEGPRTFA